MRLAAERDERWAPGYYSVLFEDPDGIRLEVKFVPGTGLLAEGPQFDPPTTPDASPCWKIRARARTVDTAYASSMTRRVTLAARMTATACRAAGV